MAALETVHVFYVDVSDRQSILDAMERLEGLLAASDASSRLVNRVTLGRIFGQTSAIREPLAKLLIRADVEFPSRGQGWGALEAAAREEALWKAFLWEEASLSLTGLAAYSGEPLTPDLREAVVRLCGEMGMEVPEWVGGLAGD